MITESEDAGADAVNGGVGDKPPAPNAEREPKCGRFLRRAPRPYDALRLAIAIVVLAAAGLKAKQLMTVPIVGTGLMESRLFLIGVVEFELLFALWLLSTLVPSSAGRGVEGDGSWTWLASIALFSAFGCASLWMALGGESNCGCFGPLKVNPWYTVALDSTFVAALVRFRPQSPRPKEILPTFSLLHVGSVVVIWALIGGAAGYAMVSFHLTTLTDAGSVIGEGNLVVLEPEKWVGKRLPLLDFIDIGEQLTTGEWTVVLYRDGCHDCEAVLRDYKERAHHEVFSSRIALIEVPPYGDSSEGSELAGPTFISGRLSEAKDWFVKTPLQLKLTDGIVSWQSEQDQASLAAEQHAADNGG